ncbi:MAG: hypothetical protein IT425_10270 [Pirellulales bacterium]|nr:hypothetical protein [Pirellulales bacterium]
MAQGAPSASASTTPNLQPTPQSTPQSQAIAAADSTTYADQGYPTSDCCEDACCDTGCGGICSSFGLGGGQLFVTADYLNVHASFSEATAFVRQNTDTGSDQFIPMVFDYHSSYRLGGGWQSCCCGDQVRFLFTRMRSDATDRAQPGDIVPFETAAPPGGYTDIDASVDARSYDLEFAKTIPLGGQCCECTDCSDPCGGCTTGCSTGCGTSCGPCCPAWDITWSGGVRWAEVGWQRSFQAIEDNYYAVTDSRSGMNFKGGGIRTGLEGRRYFFQDGWLSIYGKGNISLLLGDVNLSAIRDVNDPTSEINPVTRNTQTFRTRQIVPVTELEAGLTGQVTCRTAITAGYLFTAWHDLGFRDEHELNTLLPTTYDDANILGFDGFFARIEVGF